MRLPNERQRLTALALAAFAMLTSVGCVSLPDGRQSATAAPARAPVDYDPVTDDPVLVRVRADVDKEWPSFFPLPPLPSEEDDLEASELAAVSIGMRGRHPNVDQMCTNRRECEVPVLIRTRKLRGSGERVCFAVLPFVRYAIPKPGAGEVAPEKISFYLARWDVQAQKPVRLQTAALYAFNRDRLAPLVGATAGVFIHELHVDPGSKASVRKVLGRDYFSRLPAESGPLKSVWKIGATNTWTARDPSIGAVLGGVMAIPLVLDVRRVSAGDPNPFCKPIDPIIVNVKN